MALLIKNAHVMDPSQQLDERLDILLENGVVARLARDIAAPEAEQVDASGLIAAPGLIDLHVHLRDPGHEYKETVASGARAAAAGGFTAVACMANTHPVNDTLAVTEYILQCARAANAARVYPIGAITRGLEGMVLTEMGELSAAGCVGFSDDGRWVANGDVMRRALEYAKPFGVPLLSHAEDRSITADGVMNDGVVATELGLEGIPWVAEDAAVARDIMLAAFTGARLHICHVSTAGAVDLVRRAKQAGVRVTCEVTPHHFTLTEEAVRGYNTNARMSPPLRTKEDVAAVRSALAEGVIDAIATDHAPHHIDDKDVDFNSAVNGIVGLETALGLTLRLVEEGFLSLGQAIERLSCGPARVLNIPGGTLREGAAADVVLFDPERRWTVDPERFYSQSRNTPFAGWTLPGVVRRTIVAGRTVFRQD
jgi:dihydroorotase